MRCEQAFEGPSTLSLATRDPLSPPGPGPPGERGEDGGGERRERDPELTGKSRRGDGVSLTGGLLVWGRGTGK